MDDCNRWFLLKHDKEKGGCGHYVRVRTTCKSRWCESCSNIRTKAVMFALRREIETWQRPAHVTLTMPSLKSLGSMYETIRRKLRKMLRSVLWKSSVRRGFWSLGVTYRMGSGWHLHIHLAVDLVKYLPVKKLRALWSLGSVSIGVLPARPLSKELAKGTKGDWQRLRVQAPAGSDLRHEVDNVLGEKNLIGGFGGASLHSQKSGVCCPHCGAKYVRNEWFALKWPEQELDALIASGARVATLWIRIEWEEPPGQAPP